MTIILGIDPGSRITGYGVIKKVGQKSEYIGSGCIRLQGDELAPRLKQIFDGVREIIHQFQPTEFAIEQEDFPALGGMGGGGGGPRKPSDAAAAVAAGVAKQHQQVTLVAERLVDLLEVVAS